MSENAAVREILMRILKKWESRREDEEVGVEKTVTVPAVGEAERPSSVEPLGAKEKNGTEPTPPEEPEFFTETVIITPRATKIPSIAEAPRQELSLPSIEEEKTAIIQGATAQDILEKTVIIRSDALEEKVPASQEGRDLRDLLEETVMIRPDTGVPPSPKSNEKSSMAKREEQEDLEKTVIITPETARDKRRNGS